MSHRVSGNAWGSVQDMYIYWVNVGGGKRGALKWVGGVSVDICVSVLCCIFCNLLDEFGT